MTKATDMTIEEMKAAIEAAEAQARIKAEELKAKRDKAREAADKAHKEYMDYCNANGIATKGKRKAEG